VATPGWTWNSPVACCAALVPSPWAVNIAEGNGRFSGADHQRFVGTAHEAAVKMAARLDLCAIQGLLPTDEVSGWKKLLSRVAVMTYAMRGDGQL